MNVEVLRDRLILGSCGLSQVTGCITTGTHNKNSGAMPWFHLPRTYRANKEAERKYTCRGPPPEAGPIRLPPWSALALKRATQVDRCGCYKVQIRIFLSPVPTRGCGWLHVASCYGLLRFVHILTERGNLVLNFKLNPDVIRSSAHLALTRGSWSSRRYPPDLRFYACRKLR